MSPRRPSLAVGCRLPVLLADCGAVPGAPEAPDRTFRNAPSLDDLPTEAVALSTGIVPLGRDVRTERVGLIPREGVGTTFDQVGDDVTVFYTVAHPGSDEPMRSVGIDTCGPGTAPIETQVTISAGGFIGVATRCEG